jgi:hypothetical protein
VRRDEWFGRRFSARDVCQYVGARQVLAQPSRRADEAGIGGPVRPLKHTHATRTHHPEQPIQQRFRFMRREPLQNLIADDEIERARRGEEFRGGLEHDVSEPVTPGFASGQIQHHG